MEVVLRQYSSQRQTYERNLEKLQNMKAALVAEERKASRFEELASFGSVFYLHVISHSMQQVRLAGPVLRHFNTVLQSTDINP